MDIRDICDPFAVRSFCVEIPIQQIFISVNLLNLLSKLLPLPASAYFGQQSVCFHKSEDSFRISVTAVFVQPQMHPAIAVCIFAPLLLPGDLVYNRLIWVRTVQIVCVGVVPTPGNAKELAHPANRILLSMTIDYRIFCSSSHSLSVDRRKSRSSSFSIFRRSISYLYSAMLGSRTSPFLGRPLGFGGTPAASFRCFRLYRERNPRISLYVNPSFSPI